MLSLKKSLEMLGIIYENSSALSDFRLDHNQIVWSPECPCRHSFFAHGDSIIGGPTVTLPCPELQIPVPKLYNYRITSKYSNALQSLQACSFAKWYHILHQKVAFEAPCSCTRCGIESFLDVILHPSLNQCWKMLLFEYLAAIRYLSYTIG